MAKAIFFPLALVAFLGFMAAGAQAAEAKPEDCPYWVGYGPMGLPSGEFVCARNGDVTDSFAGPSARSVSSCANILFKIIEVLYQKQGSYQWADFKDFMSEEAFMMLDPALKQLKFKPSVDIHAILSQSLFDVKVEAGQLVKMGVLLDTWAGAKVRFSSAWSLENASVVGGRKLAAVPKWKLTSVSDVIVF